jgi:hypothetical protein
LVVAQTGIHVTIFGLGLGGCMQPVMLAIQSAVPPQGMGVAASSGGTLGTAVCPDAKIGACGG